MPCSPGMSACRASCRHRLFVREYQAARHAEELAREEACLGYETEEAAYGPLLTFKKWLLDHASPDPEDALSVDWDTFFSTPTQEFNP